MLLFNRYAGNGRSKMSEEHLAVRRIKEGTVIDHIDPGEALRVLSALGVTGHNGNLVTIAMNVSSSKLKGKDVIKVENRFLEANETNKIALIASHATVNIIRNFKVVEKRKVHLPDALEDVFSCPNPTCISNSGEPLKPFLRVIARNPPKLQCKYCMKILKPEELL
ncbi:MAG: aspartate carbamoyltransferase regulatory subunit [Nitrososphaerales archaeon]|nr:aspartate carbamoyltransferase regulatory subunit [Nitrososphaerales archaeon]